MTASIPASKFKNSDIHKFKLSSAENQQKRKCALGNAQKAKKKHRNTTDKNARSVKRSLQKEPKHDVGSVPSRVNEIGEPTILRPISTDETHTDVFKSLRSQSHYNSLLFLHRNTRMDAFQMTSAPKWMNCLNKWQARSNFPWPTCSPSDRWVYT